MCRRAFLKNDFTKIYLATTNDRFELPIFETKSIKEMSLITGLKETSILSAIARHGSCGNKKYRFYRLYLKNE